MWCLDNNTVEKAAGIYSTTFEKIIMVIHYQIMSYNVAMGVS